MSHDLNLDSLDPATHRALDSTPTDGTGALNPYPSDGGAEKPHVLDYLRVLHRRRWPALTGFVIVFLYLVVDAFMATPIYEARARLLIEAGKPNVVAFQDVVEEGQARSDYYETQYNLLRSRSVARRTLDALKLLDNKPAPGAQPVAPTFSLRGSINRALTSGVSFALRPFRPSPPHEALPADETAAQAQAIDALLGSLAVKPVRNSRIVDLTFRSADPVLAARVVNEHAKAYIEQNMEFRFLTSKEATDWLSARLAESRAEVEAAQNALQRYLEQNQAVSLNDRDNVVVQRLTDVSVATTRAKTERIDKEAIYNRLLAVQNNPAALDAFPAIVENAFIQQQKMELATLQRQELQMHEKLGDKNPEMVKTRLAISAVQAKIQAEIARVVQAVKNDFLDAQARERSLVDALEAQKREALSTNQKSIEYGVLRREADSAQQIYNSLLQRAKETGVSAELRTASFRIVDPAEIPRTPVSPNKRGAVTQGFLFGLGVALALAFFIEYLDNRVRRPEEIKALGLAMLGIIPAVPTKKNQSVIPLTTEGVPPAFIEAVRRIRTNVLFSSADEGPRSIVVTSAEPSEGKTVVATNLAIAFAQAGHRVLLIDADMRRPQVHQRFGVKGEPGLSNLLVGSVKASEVVRRVAVPGLWLLPAGLVPPNAAELLGSRRFRDFLASLREHFDWIILDTPPVLAVTDATVVGHQCSGVVLVLGAEMVSRQAARTAVEQLDTARARVLGAVLNRVDVDRHAYYYSHYYRRDYARYYVGREI